MNTEREPIDGEPIDLPPLEQVPAIAENDPFAKGRERMARAGETIVSLKERMKSTLSRFWSKTKRVGFEAGAVVLSADELAKKGYENVVGWKDKKVEQVKAFGLGKIELAKDVATYVQEKGSEKLNNAKEGISNRWSALKNYGENAYMSAKMEIARVKDAYNKRKNEILMRRLLEEYNNVKAAESAAAATVEMHKRAKEALEQKMLLLRGLEATA